MAEPLKHMYNPAFFERLCPVMRNTIPQFDCKRFIFNVFNNEWPDMELKQRVTHIAKTLHAFMPDNFETAAAILVQLSVNLKKSGLKEQGFATIFIPEYFLLYGLDHPDTSLDALREITKLVSAEFAIRPFIKQYPSNTMERMLQWSKDSHASVRRLASEGCRPRLPWAIGLPSFKEDPSLILPILNNLKADPSEYVRRSVANNLNDIAKDHPELVLKIAKEWIGTCAETNAIIRHACRSLLKKGNNEALILHGINPKGKAVISGLAIQKKKIKVGDELVFNFEFSSKENRPAPFRLEYAIDYVTSSRKISRKIFKIAETTYGPKDIVPFKRKQSFKNLTTRKHYGGNHALTILVNGRPMESIDFKVTS